jgi:hypothetical protein
MNINMRANSQMAVHFTFELFLPFSASHHDTNVLVNVVVAIEVDQSFTQ